MVRYAPFIVPKIIIIDPTRFMHSAMPAAMPLDLSILFYRDEAVIFFLKAQYGRCNEVSGRDYCNLCKDKFVPKLIIKDYNL